MADNLTCAQKRTIEDLKWGVGIFIDKGGRICHLRQPRMDLYYMKVIDQTEMERLRKIETAAVNLIDAIDNNPPYIPEGIDLLKYALKSGANDV